MGKLVKHKVDEALNKDLRQLPLWLSIIALGACARFLSYGTHPWVPLPSTQRRKFMSSC
jgi:hypothetical protein